MLVGGSQPTNLQQYTNRAWNVRGYAGCCGYGIKSLGHIARLSVCLLHTTKKDQQATAPSSPPPEYSSRIGQNRNRRLQHRKERCFFLLTTLLPFLVPAFVRERPPTIAKGIASKASGASGNRWGSSWGKAGPRTVCCFRCFWQWGSPRTNAGPRGVTGVFETL